MLVLTADCVRQSEKLGIRPGEVLKAVGRDTPDEYAVSEAPANLNTQIAAKFDACRNLVESAKGVSITSNTKVKDFITTEDKTDCSL